MAIVFKPAPRPRALVTTPEVTPEVTPEAPSGPVVTPEPRDLPEAPPLPQPLPTAPPEAPPMVKVRPRNVPTNRKPVAMTLDEAKAKGYVPLPKTSPSDDQKVKSGRTDAKTAVDRMLARGEITLRTAPDLKDPDVRADFHRLMMVGASTDTIRKVLGLTVHEIAKLKREYIENAVESLANVGVVGMVALSFDRMEEASRRAMQAAANAGDGPQALSALRLVKDIESDKIDLLIRTGAIRVKKKVEISGAINFGDRTDTEQFDGEKAQRVMVNIMGLLESETSPEGAEAEGPIVDAVTTVHDDAPEAVEAVLGNGDEADVLVGGD